MNFIREDFYADFMRWRALTFIVSSALVVVSIVFLFYPGANWGIDFAGGTEIQVNFRKPVTSDVVRAQLSKLGYKSPEVVKVENGKNEYILRVREVSAMSAGKAKSFRAAVAKSFSGNAVEEYKVSPGGDKLTFKFNAEADPEAIKASLLQAGAKVRAVAAFGQRADHRYEVQLVGIADQLIERLSSAMGEAGPNPPRRVEWVGPKAGEQLRDAAIKSFLYAMAFIMLYVALRFDLRFAPGAVIAMAHDAIITMGIFMALGREVNLTFVAAILTIMGYSVNDTIVIYDRIRENMSRRRGMSLRELINVSTSETLSRTIITGGTTVLSLIALYMWGTTVIRDFALAMLLGILIGTYSSVYTAAPITEWIDQKFFRGQRKAVA